MKTIKLILAVVLCVLTLAACKAESTPASVNEDITTVRAAKEDREDKTEREETEKAADETEAETTAETQKAEEAITATPFPETVFRYTADKNDTFIDSQTGEILLTLNKSDERYEETKPKNFIRFEEGFMRYTISDNDGYIFIDMNGNIVPRPANALPDDIVEDYPQVSADGVYIAKDGSFYGLKNTNGDIIADFIYKDIKPNADYTLFAFSLNKKGGVMNTTGETILYANSSNIEFYENNICANNSLYNLTGTLLLEQFSPTSAIKLGDNYLTDLTQEVIGITYDNFIIDTNGNVIKHFPRSIDTDYEELGQYYEMSRYEIDHSLTYTCFPIQFNGTGADAHIILIDQNGNSLPIDSIYEEKIFSYLSKSENYTALTDGDKNKTYLINNENAIATIEGYRVALLNDYILYSDTNKTLTLYDFNMNEIATATYNKYKISNDTIVYSDADTGLYGVIIGDKIIHDARFTSASINEAGTVITAERGNDKFYYTVATGAEIVFPE